jgi:putative nucleotidyltransferase with HDIG domain
MSKPRGSRAQGTARSRREGIRRILPETGFDPRSLLQRPERLHGAVLVAAVAVLGTLLAAWASAREEVVVGEIATRDRLNPVSYEVVDEAATAGKREEARRAAPRIYRPNAAYLDPIRAAIEGLPAATFERQDLSQIDPRLQEAFALDEAALAELQAFGGDEERTAEWRRWTAAFLQSLWAEDPLLSASEYQIFATTLRREVLSADELRPVRLRTAIDLGSGDSQSLELPVRRLAERAGFPRALAPLAAAPVLREPRPTLLFDEERTAAAAAAAAAAVPPSMRRQERGGVIVARGDRTTREQASLLAESREQERRAGHRSAWRWVGFAGLLALPAALFAAWLSILHPAVARNASRMAGLLVLTLGVAAVAVAGGIEFPMAATGLATLCGVSAAIVATVCYHRGFGVAVTLLFATLVAACLGQGIAAAAAIAAPALAASAMLKELRHRACLMRAGAAAGGTAIASFLLLGVLETPGVAGAAAQVIERSLIAGGGAVAAGFLMLGVLPSIERLFGVATGLTLSELRDPRQPLLRMLQQRAPGTYSHSLQIATIAEAAAESIGADGLLVYVGALYHDIGKVNKPDYFIENQTEGPNRHDKLNPKLSLLVIVGHVKDGIALAREHGLPRVLDHFIESHHGTTLVEHFYRAAQSRAEALGEEEPPVAEFEFRYPGPRPRTPEAAILMLADAAESASRSIGDPTASRIESLVRTLARRRLEDGQFDECSLTFRQLRAIEDSIIKSLLSIRHGRISYPSTSGEAEAKPPQAGREEASPLPRIGNA